MAKVNNERPLTAWQLREAIIRSQGFSAVDDGTYLDGYQSRGVYKPEEVAIAYPINPMTGLAMTDLSRVMSPTITHAERESIMSRFKSSERGAYMPSELSDKEILDLVPPRYLAQDAVDVQLWRDYLTTELFPEMKPAVEKVLPDEPTPQDLPPVME